MRDILVKIELSNDRKSLPNRAVDPLGFPADSL